MLEKDEISSSDTITTVDPLRDKVVLLFDGTNEGGRSLAVSLAKYGADIALVYRQAHAGLAREMKSLVEAEGRRCLIIQAQTDDETFSQEVVRQTVNTLGRLDIFIDYSSIEPREQNGPINDVDVVEKRDSVEQQNGPFTHVEIMSAVFDQMTRIDQTNQHDDKPDENGKRSDQEMRVAQELINKPIISLEGGQMLGTVQSFYLDQDLTHMVAIYLGTDDLQSEKKNLIKWSDVETFGRDVILVKDADCIMNSADMDGIENHIRRDEINGRMVYTPGGTKIGRIDDVISEGDAKIIGFGFSETFVPESTIAANQAISRTSIIEISNEDGVMTANLAEAEKVDL
jgi:sporulation protein YlmC with PRC-barrel domain